LELILIKLKHILNGVVVSEIDMHLGDFTIGRSQGNSLQIEDGVVSGEHALIKVERSPYMESIFDITIKDLNSTNGTYVNSDKVNEKRLKHGDQIRVGTHEFKIYDSQAGVGTQTEFYVPEE
jgi:pSer/pThr/pTyr-binding forkhead associated (FHA) protein